MEYSDEILRYEERIIFRLRSLYSEFNYSQYRMSRFEEYELYAGNRAFMPSGEILTFTGVGGKLMALRPDVTLSIVKYIKDDGELSKLYYNENVYRSDKVEFKEQMQVGLECIGRIDVPVMAEVLMLAKRSLDVINVRSCLEISHMGYLSGLLQSINITSEQRSEIVDSIREKNTPELKAICKKYGFNDSFCENVITLTMLYGPYADVSDELRRICVNKEMRAALQELDELHSVLSKYGVRHGVNIDFSTVNDISYYSGIIFQGYIDGIPEKVLSGGRYDELLRKFGKKSDAIGFAVYLNVLSQLDSNSAKAVAENDTGTKAAVNTEAAAGTKTAASTGTAPVTESAMINIALPKGRLGEKAYAIFEAAGYGCPEIREESRKLVFENRKTGVRYFWVKPSDVARYVERGAADLGVVGKDILLEYSPEVYELLDFGIGKCNVSVAAQTGFSSGSSDNVLRVATTFPNIARAHFQKQGREIDVIELNGSVELAPLLGLSDVIVDIVETGQTLLENNMKPIEHIVDVSARLISNKTSYKFNHKNISKLCAKIAGDSGGR
ncbi:MAG: ATP phosphoribosyltransferase [Oscillospiraceae bacterium]|nr:ATP phosphoribosyltransferase [Oscillospiraceae bacterium]